MNSTLKWYRLAKDGTGVERCEVGIGSGECEVAVQADDWLSWVVNGGGGGGGGLSPPLRRSMNIHSMKLFNNLIKNTLLAPCSVV